MNGCCRIDGVNICSLNSTAAQIRSVSAVLLSHLSLPELRELQEGSDWSLQAFELSDWLSSSQRRSEEQSVIFISSQTAEVQK